MISIGIHYGNPSTDEWDLVCMIPFISHEELYPDSNSQNDSWGINDHEISLPNAEILTISAAFTEYNFGISMILKEGENVLVSYFGFKKGFETDDPCILFQTPGGADVSIMFGKHS
jgi:hypothetical protein